MRNHDFPELYSGVQVIFFDVTGTLIEVKGSVGDIYSRFARRYGIDPEPERINAAFSQYFRLQPPLAFPPGTPSLELRRLEYAWWRKLVAEIFDGNHFDGFERFFAEIFDYFGNPDAWQVYSDVVPVLEALKMRGLRLAVISNFDTRLYGLLRAVGLDSYFDGVYVSSCMGAAKPDLPIFETALVQMDVKPQNALHIGDSLYEDVTGARAAGIKTLLLDRAGLRTPGDDVRCIAGLNQLAELL